MYDWSHAAVTSIFLHLIAFASVVLCVFCCVNDFDLSHFEADVMAKPVVRVSKKLELLLYRRGESSTFVEFYYIWRLFANKRQNSLSEWFRLWRRDRHSRHILSFMSLFNLCSIFFSSISKNKMKAIVNDSIMQIILALLMQITPAALRLYPRRTTKTVTLLMKILFIFFKKGETTQRGSL